MRFIKGGVNKLNELWKCVYNNVGQFYFAKFTKGEVIISDGFSTVRNYVRHGVNGCAYNGETIWLSIESCNYIIAVDSNNDETYIEVPLDGIYRIHKAASGNKNYLILDVIREGNHAYVLFDCVNKIIITRLPITRNCDSHFDTLDELYVETENDTGHIICEYRTEVPPRYRDEMPDVDVLFYADLSWDVHDSVAKITKQIHLNIDYETSESISGRQTLLADSGLRFPLFDYYLRHWLIQKSFSTSGKSVVYYCADISGLIIGEPNGGRVCQIIELPSEIAEKTYQFFFDDLRSQLYVIGMDNDIKVYSINCTDHNAVNVLNQAYDDAYANAINLQRRRDAGDLSFWNILKHAVEAFSCKSVISRESISFDDRERFAVTIETPISGILLSENTQKNIVSFEHWDFKKKVFLSHTDMREKFVFKSKNGQFSAVFSIDEKADEKGFLSIEHVLTTDIIEKNCNREAARKKLQIDYKNVYAMAQLGYVGTVEDYNFVLAIMEDYYCKSVVNHGKNNENVKTCISTILKLATKYHRIDGIPLLQKLLIMADSIELDEIIRKACISLSEIPKCFAVNKQFRVDLEVETPIDIEISDCLNNLHITHYVQDKENQSASSYYLRSSSEQFVLEVQIAGVTLPLDIAAENGPFHLLRVREEANDIFEIECMTEKYPVLIYSLCKNNGTVGLRQYIGGAVEYINDTVVPKRIRISDFVTEIERGAFQGQNVTEVIGCTQLKLIGEEAFQYSQLRSFTIPDGVYSIGKGAFGNCRHLEKIILSHSLHEVSDGMLEKTAIRSIEIPGSVERIGEKAFADCILLKEVTIKHGVEIIAAGAFSGCRDLTSIIIPSSVNTIESRAFDKCSNIAIRGAKGSYVERYALKNDIVFIPETDDGEKGAESKKGELYVEKFPDGKMVEYLRRFEEMLGEIKRTGDDTNSKVTSLVHFVENDLQAWITSNRPKVDDEYLIEKFASKAVDYINMHVLASDQKVQEEEIHLRNIFGNTWYKLLPTTQSSLISAGVLWKLCADISEKNFDYSGIIIAATSALESELKRVFYTDFQEFMLKTYGNPTVQSAEKTYTFWPERLLSKTKVQYDNELIRGTTSLPQLADNFTMGTLPYMFTDKSDTQKKLLLKRMEEYLKSIVKNEFCMAPVKAFNDKKDANSFVRQCESIRTLYRNPAGHVDVLSRESAEACYAKVVGVGKVDAFRITHEVEGLIMILYSYLK